MTYGADLYKKTTKAAATPFEIFIELYDEAVKRLEEALQAVHDKRYEDRYHATERVRIILIAFVEALDRSTPEQAEVADNLQDFYSMIGSLLGRINVHNDPEACQTALDSMSKVRDNWRAMYKEVRDTPTEQVTPQSGEDVPGVEVSA